MQHLLQRNISKLTLLSKLDSSLSDEVILNKKQADDFYIKKIIHNNVQIQNERCKINSKLTSKNCMLNAEKNNIFFQHGMPYQNLNITNHRTWLGFYGLQWLMNRKIIIQQTASLKTYSYNNIRSKYISNKKTQSDRTGKKSILEQLTKFYRETINIRKKKTIMKKKKSYHLESENKDVENKTSGQQTSNFEGAIKKIDSTLSKHVLKQAEKKESADPNISLNCISCPYIPCPLPPPKMYLTSQNLYSYKHASLAPLFTVDPLIMNKDKSCKNEQSKNMNKCIGINFWNPFPNVNNGYDKPSETRKNSSTNKTNSSVPLQPTNLPKQEQSPLYLLGINSSKDTLKANNETTTSTNFKVSNKVKSEIPETSLANKKSMSIENQSNSFNTIQFQNKLTKNCFGKDLNHVNTIKKSIFKKKDIKLRSYDKTQGSCKHLHLNFPFQMTSPNRMKSLKLAQAATVLKQNVGTENQDKIKILKYNSNKLLHQIKHYNKTKVNKNEKSFYTNKDRQEPNKITSIVTKLTQPEFNLSKSCRTQHPLTSPNNTSVKNTS